jgi:hypothetical protein
MECIECKYWGRDEDSYEDEFEEEWQCFCYNASSPFYEIKIRESDTCEFYETLE